MLKSQLDTKRIMHLVASKHILNFFRYSTFSPLIFSVIVNLTNRCNLKCYMCQVGLKNRKGQKQQFQDIDLSVLEKLIHLLSSALFFKPRLHFASIGEPLLYKNFLDLISICRETNWSITTNGYLLSSYFQQIADCHCVSLNVSLHGDQQVHDEIVGVKGATEKVSSGIVELYKYKKQRKKHFPKIVLNCVISKKNIKHLREILRFFLTLPVERITFQHLSFTLSDYEKKEDNSVPNSEDIPEIIDFVSYVRRAHLNIPVLFIPEIKIKDIPGYYTDLDYKFGTKCVFPWLSLMVKPDGIVTACNGIPLGNLHSESINEIWNNYQNREFRNKIRKYGISGNCQRCCHRQYY